MDRGVPAVHGRQAGHPLGVPGAACLGGHERVVAADGVLIAGGLVSQYPPAAQFPALAHDTEVVQVTAPAGRPRTA